MEKSSNIIAKWEWARRALFTWRIHFADFFGVVFRLVGRRHAECSLWAFPSLCSSGAPLFGSLVLVESILDNEDCRTRSFVVAVGILRMKISELNYSPKSIQFHTKISERLTGELRDVYEGRSCQWKNCRPLACSALICSPPATYNSHPSHPTFIR